MDSREVLKLATLARVEISPEEAESLSHEFEAILSYVSDVKVAGTKSAGDAASTAMRPEDIALKNVMREDANAHESGIYTEKILEEAPSREGQYIKVKKIL